MALRRRVLLLVTLLVSSLGCSGSDEATVHMRELRFEPGEVRVKAGASVTWVNDSTFTHTVTAEQEDLPPGAAYFASGGAASEEQAAEQVQAGLVGDGQRFEMTFETPGRYRYVCIPHEGQGMAGVVVVE